MCGDFPVDFICVSTIVVRLDMFMLEMKVQGFFTKDFSGRKVYRKGIVISWEIELGAIL